MHFFFYSVTIDVTVCYTCLGDHVSISCNVTIGCGIAIACNVAIGNTTVANMTVANMAVGCSMAISFYVSIGNVTIIVVVVIIASVIFNLWFLFLVGLYVEVCEEDDEYGRVEDKTGCDDSVTNCSIDKFLGPYNSLWYFNCNADDKNERKVHLAVQHIDNIYTVYYRY